MKDKYLLWVGGVYDIYNNFDDALYAYEEWLSQGYDDVVLEEVKS